MGSFEQIYYSITPLLTVFPTCVWLLLFRCIITSYLLVGMNWTGGRLQRHSKGNSNATLKAQKQHFAKARLQNHHARPAPSPLRFSSFQVPLKMPDHVKRDRSRGVKRKASEDGAGVLTVRCLHDRIIDLLFSCQLFAYETSTARPPSGNSFPRRLFGRQTRTDESSARAYYCQRVEGAATDRQREP